MDKHLLKAIRRERSPAVILFVFAGENAGGNSSYRDWYLLLDTYEQL